MRYRPLAAELVQTPAFAMSFISECEGEPASIEMRATGAVLVNHTVVCKFWTVQAVHLRQSPHRDVLEHNGQQVVGIWRTSWQIDDGLTRNNRINSNRTRRIRIS